MEGSNLSARRRLKNDYFEIENWWCGALRLFVCMYRHFGIVGLLCVEWGFAYSWVLNLYGW